jgi:DNA polymerase-4
VGERLRAEVRAQSGLAVSVGIAPVKLVAKIASDAAKPDGLLEIPAERVREVLEPLPVGRIWGVGPVAQAQLAAAGFRTVGDLARADAARLETALGPWGLDVARLARGDDLSEVEPYREPVSLSEENTFPRDVGDRALLESTIRVHADAVARRLRHGSLRARTVVLKLKLARRRSSGPRGYPLLTRRATLPEATDDGDAIASAARELLERVQLREPVRLLGVGVTKLQGEAGGQLSLFPPPESQARSARLNRALDELARRFGSEAVTRGGLEPAERAGLSLQIKRGTPEDRPE